MAMVEAAIAEQEASVAATLLVLAGAMTTFTKKAEVGVTKVVLVVVVTATIITTTLTARATIGAPLQHQ